MAFGPRHANSRDAGLLLAAGGGASVPTGRGLAELVRRWRSSAAFRAQSGAAARGVVQAGLGADLRAWALVAGLLGAPSAFDAGQPPAQ